MQENTAAPQCSVLFGVKSKNVMIVVIVCSIMMLVILSTLISTMNIIIMVSMEWMQSCKLVWFCLIMIKESR